MGNPTSTMVPGMEGWGGTTGGWSGGGASTGGQNQYMSYPSLPNFNPQFSTSSPWAPGGKPGTFFGGQPGGRSDLGGNMFTAPTYDPTFTSQYFNMLHGLMGQSGGLQNNLLSFLQGGPTTMPGAPQLSEMATTGSPISALPEWQQMLQAQQRNIGENQANLKEQFAFAGDLQSSPFGTAMTDYMSQTTKDQNALLAQMQTQALESAMQRELGAGMGLQQEAGAESQFLQQLLSGGAFASPQIFNKPKTSGLGGLLGGIGSLLGGIGQFGSAAKGAGGIGKLFSGMI